MNIVPQVSAGAFAAKRSVAELSNRKIEPKKSGTKKTSEKSGKYKRDERRVISEGVYKTLTEDRHQDTCGAAAYKSLNLNCTAKKVPATTDRAIRNLTQVCDGSLW